MNRIVCFLTIALTAATQAHGALINHGKPETFIGATSPSSLKWEIATATDQRVGFEIPNLKSGTFAGITQWGIRQNTAALYNLDWAAFQAAANDPAYTRSIISFGGITRENPLFRDFVPGSFVLGSIGAQLEHWVVPVNLYGFPLHPFIAVGAGSPLNIPEPSTLALAILAISLLMPRRR